MTISFHLSQIKNIATQLWQQFHQYKIWAFNAQMGAGKTTLIHAICEVLNVRDTVSSPTFAIINEYETGVAGNVYHMDWYRLKDATEVVQAGCEDCIESGNLCFIEWPEKAPELLSSNTLFIQLEILTEDERRLTINA